VKDKTGGIGEGRGIPNRRKSSKRAVKKLKGQRRYRGERQYEGNIEKGGWKEETERRRTMKFYAGESKNKESAPRTKGKGGRLDKGGKGPKVREVSQRLKGEE